MKKLFGVIPAILFSLCLSEAKTVDRILAKVHDQGMASLTRKEKKTLAAATRRYQEDDQRRL